MSAKTIHRIIVVEDRPASLEWLTGALDLAFPNAQVSTAEDVKGGRSLLKRAPDLALIDLGLPDGSGVELIAELSTKHPDCMSVVITIFDDDEHLFSALRAGAQGYLLKEGEQQEIADSLAGIIDGKPPLSPAIARRLLDTFGGKPAEIEEPLTQREREILVLITKGYKLSEAAQALEVSRNTIAYHVKNIYRKLQVTSRAEAAMEATRLGLTNPHL